VNDTVPPLVKAYHQLLIARSDVEDIFRAQLQAADANMALELPWNRKSTIGEEASRQLYF
jgi:hypothetical protein